MKVSGRRSGRVSIAGLIALRPGCQTRLCYRIRVHHGRRGERRSLSETDYMRLVDGVHQMLKAPIVLLWDRLNTDVSKVTQRLMAARSWLTVVLLPACAPELTVYRPATLDGFMAETELGLPPSCPQSAEVSNQPQATFSVMHRCLLRSSRPRSGGQSRTLLRGSLEAATGLR
ncbi:IS630 family transposase [Streptomyces sp. NPDC056159]|uniref:IS630 family transposase n=1 Tax=Streptomyces sp. NPDC056159 TaxID=3155537 RepID=UPI0034410BDD